jgi:hypothetical protein
VDALIEPASYTKKASLEAFSLHQRIRSASVSAPRSLTQNNVALATAAAFMCSVLAGRAGSSRPEATCAAAYLQREAVGRDVQLQILKQIR